MSISEKKRMTLFCLTSDITRSIVSSFTKVLSIKHLLKCNKVTLMRLLTEFCETIQLSETTHFQMIAFVRFKVAYIILFFLRSNGSHLHTMERKSQGSKMYSYIYPSSC